MKSYCIHCFKQPSMWSEGSVCSCFPTTQVVWEGSVCTAVSPLPSVRWQVLYTAVPHNPVFGEKVAYAAVSLQLWPGERVTYVQPFSHYPPHNPVFGEKVAHTVVLHKPVLGEKVLGEKEKKKKISFHESQKTWLTARDPRIEWFAIWLSAFNSTDILRHWKTHCIKEWCRRCRKCFYRPVEYTHTKLVCE